MDKKGLSERDICTKFITPAVLGAGWDAMRQVREEVGFTKAISYFPNPPARDGYGLEGHACRRAAAD